MAMFNRCTNLLKNNKGMSLPVVMITATVGLILTVSITQSLMGGSNMVSSREKVTAYQNFAENFKNILEDPGACTEILGGAQLNLTGDRITRNIPIDHDSDTRTKQLNDEWKDAEGTFGLTSVELEVLSSTSINYMRNYEVADYGTPPPADPKPNGYVVFTYPVRVLLHGKGVRTQLTDETDSTKLAEHANDFAFEEAAPLNQKSPDIRIYVNVDSNNAVVNCFGYKTQAAVCGSQGGSYDFNPSDGQDNDFPNIRCKPNKRCFVSPDGLVNNPNQCKAPYNYENAQHMGKINGQDTYMCTWCHPHRGDDGNFTDPTGRVANSEDDWLEKQWLRLANEARVLMDNGVAATDPSVMDIAAQWEHLLNASQDGLMVDDASDAFTNAEAAVDKVAAEQAKQTTKRNEIAQLEAEISTVTDDIEALRLANRFGVQQPSQSQMDQLQQNLADAEAALAADPNNPALQSDLTDRQDQLAAANAVINDANLGQTLQDRLAAAEASLQQAQSELSAIDSALAQAESELAAMNDVNGTGQSASDFIDPINQIEQYLLTEYGIDRRVIDYVNSARGV